MKVLVAYATRHGATRGIAERIGATLEKHGLVTTVLPVEDVREVAAFDAFVVGSAAYMGRWLGEAARFVRAHRQVLATAPTWLFSSGPIGTDRIDSKGRDVIEASRPQDLTQLEAAVHPRGERVFFGAFDPDAAPIGVWERLGAPFLRMPAVRNAMPAGDFRDWPAIEAWAHEIAARIVPTTV